MPPPPPHPANPRARLAACALLALAPAAPAQLSRARIDDLRAQGARQGWTFTVGQNPATAIPLEKLCGLTAPPPDETPDEPGLYGPAFEPMDLPATFDWRSLDGVTPIRNQGPCGSCWAFATVGPLECAIRIKDGLSVNLSEQYLVSCNNQGWGCDGGWWAHEYHRSRPDPCGGIGAVYETDFPYQASDLPCSCPFANHPYTITSWSYIGNSYSVPDTAAIKQAIMTYGPVTAGIAVDDAFHAYTGGIFNACYSGAINHGVVLVGWDDDQGGGVWFLRNSWGTGWGESGYMKITYGCSRVGYASCYVVYPGQEPLAIAPADGLDSTGEVGGPFTPASRTYTLTNNGTAPLDWTATRSQNWLDVAPASGTLAASASVDVNVAINANANTLPVGTWTDQVLFTDTTHGKTRTRDVQLKVGHVDAFTELLEADNDLDHLSLTFAPDGSAHYYAACARSATAFPTAPAGGTALALSGDNNVHVTLAGGATVSLYGQAYTDFYVGANGYITFGAGGTDATPSLDDHFRQPRIAALFADLSPAAGQVTRKQLLDRAVITFQNVPGAGAGPNSFQIEMFFDGQIRLTWLDLDAAGALAGLSAGSGTPGDYQPSDLTAYAACPPQTHRADCDGDSDIDLADFAHFQLCLTGNRVYAINPPCADMDLDDDGDVDTSDSFAFRGCLSGPRVPPACGCLGGSP